MRHQKKFLHCPMHMVVPLWYSVIFTSFPSSPISTLSKGTEQESAVFALFHFGFCNGVNVKIVFKINHIRFRHSAKFDFNLRSTVRDRAGKQNISPAKNRIPHRQRMEQVDWWIIFLQ